MFKKWKFKRLGLALAACGLALFSCATPNVLAVDAADVEPSVTQPITDTLPDEGQIWFTSTATMHDISVVGSDIENPATLSFSYDSSGTQIGGDSNLGPVANVSAVYVLASVRFFKFTDDLYHTRELIFYKWSSRALERMANLSPFYNSFLVYTSSNSTYIFQYGVKTVSYLPFSPDGTYTQTFPVNSVRMRSMGALFSATTQGISTYNMVPSVNAVDMYLNDNLGSIWYQLRDQGAETAYKNGYSAGYIDGQPVGYKDGQQDGYDTGYAAGYAAGESSVSESGLVMSNIFGAVASVPINVLNGLAPLVIWNVPIISICLSFVFIGIVLYIVRKFI